MVSTSIQHHCGLDVETATESQLIQYFPTQTVLTMIPLIM